MAIPVSASEASTMYRPFANFQPTIWGHKFLSHNTDSKENGTDGRDEKQDFEKLKEELKEKLTSAITEDDELTEKLELIDALQRLGVSYRFQCEIERILKHVYLEEINNKVDLNTTALRFRLLRQHGYNVSSGCFDAFKNDERKFKVSLANDPQGLLSLYEAAHLRVHGEDNLEEALEFTSSHLQSHARNYQSSPFAAQIAKALFQPIHKSMVRFEAKKHISLYQTDASKSKLLNFAKLDFKRLQKMHQVELSDITKWWKDLEAARKFPFARDRIVECYFWTLGVYFEPEYSLARNILTKVIALSSIMDDIYDAYATFQELELLTEAIQRWDIDVASTLPDYMNEFYKALLDVYNDIEDEMTRTGNTYRVHYAKEAMKRQARAYFEEARWLHINHTPSVEEYLEVALVTAGFSLLQVISMLGMGEIATEDAFEWIYNRSKFVRASELICRLTDDIVGHEFEQKRDHVSSSVECHMKQYRVTKEQAITELRKQIDNAWKDINQECLHPTAVPKTVLTRILNFTRVIDVLYKEEDCYTHNRGLLKDLIRFLLIESV